MNNRKNKTTYSKTVKNIVSDLPFFRVENLVNIDIEKKYIRVLLHRFFVAGEILRLKKGIYVSKKYLDKIEKANRMNSYLEFIAITLYDPAYLSAEYVLSEHSVLTENIQAFTLISKNRTRKFVNSLGAFNYKHIKEDLFSGFKIIKKNDFFINKATIAKALFDFLYLRKNIITDKSAFLALRLNVENFKNQDLKEFKKYIEIEGSEKMKNILSWLQK
ncbi:MAG: hypothetical protein Q7T79_03505 [bacterium]|nr:hypothetical protein [bacterium]